MGIYCSVEHYEPTIGVRVGNATEWWNNHINKGRLVDGGDWMYLSK